ncbi:hypothetical protein [Spirochaeta africana]|uniref:Uncharacterized protein n=1 Tax=Spirochaeta africana (strain ATCC 700263 / DSM 8902 / Z-7692) TaxID=889378 RepID=H9UGX1_SPIAZ|nr:hypothetical protein [Spirochaeta africana]AFG36764.1 hypothetical protein Spiaf_0664 [Spirochaeta africana DSM 8902]
MVALLVGLIFTAAGLFAVLPMDWALQWGPEVIQFLKGGLPVLAFFIGFLAMVIGIADIKDRIEARKEEAEEAAQTQE